MSEAPRVELNNTDLDFDLSAPANQFQQTSSNTPLKLQNDSDSQQSNGQNGQTAQNLQNSAIKAKDSILDSKVCGTKTPPTRAENHPNAMHYSLIFNPHTSQFSILTPTKQLPKPCLPPTTTLPCRTQRRRS
jgi:hypothetical protein